MDNLVTTQSSLKPASGKAIMCGWTLVLIFTLAICFAVGGGEAQSRDAREQPATTLMPGGLAPDVPRRGSYRVRVTLFLEDNSIGRALGSQNALTGRLPGAAAARRAALGSPDRVSPQERRIASMMDDQRNSILAVIRRAALSGSRQSERVARAVERLGGEVVAATPFPNALTVLVRADDLEALRRRPEILAIEMAPRARWASSPIDGSQIWHTNGFTGGGPSADGIGGPDYVAFDQGLRTSHNAFNTRLIGDCGTCLGTGASRVISPSGRTDFSGSKHGNIVGASVAGTDLRAFGTTGPPYPASWQTQKGQAFGLDKLYDPYQAKNAGRWVLGIDYLGESGVSDLPEALNYSAGAINDDVDLDASYVFVDAEVERLGVAWTVSAGNCGVADPGFTGCGDGPHRVESPASNYNAIAVGGLDIAGQPYNETAWTAWEHSSPGPTFGGRKKPDLLAEPFPAAGTPSQTNDTDYTSGGQGTSYAAPQVASGIVLLASAGVFSPTAQKAILVNSATPIQGQTYWSPVSGWGALNLDSAFNGRANYANSSVLPAGDNAARFFEQSGVSPGDRTTLVWNRRTVGSITGAISHLTLTNLDLTQLDPGSGNSTASGGSDAGDTVDADQTISPANPMPGNGSDGGDNVEQVRSTASGTQVFKVKAMSAIDGATSEAFSIAGSHPVTTLASPVPEIALDTSAASVRPGDDVTVTAEIDNPSTDLGLVSASVTLELPTGVSLVSGDATQSIGDLDPSEVDSVSWIVEGTSDGLKSLDATVSGVTYDEPFSGSDTANISVDGIAPTVSISGPSPYSDSANVPFSWSGSDANGVATYDVQISRNQSPFETLIAGTTSTSTQVLGGEGDRLLIRLAATDAAGNVSTPVELSTTIDAEPPTIALGPTQYPSRGVAVVPIDAGNVGSPFTVAYRFAKESGTLAPLAGRAARFANTTTRPVTADLRVEATDGLGRTSVATRSVLVPATGLDPDLKIRKASNSGGYLVVSGTVSRKAKGRVTLTARRVGRRGSAVVTKSATPRRGKFKVKLKLKPGQYRLIVTRKASGGYFKDSVSRTTSVR